MLTLIFFILMEVFAVGSVIWAMRAVARWRGDPVRSAWRYLGAMLLVTAITVAINWAIIASVPPDQTAGRLAAAAVAFLADLGITAIIFHAILGLNGKGLVAGMVTQLVAGGIWLAIMLGIVRPFVCEAYVIPTDSMAPTIITGDRFVATKLVSPRRWDVTVFHPPKQPGNIVWVKRLVGLPGETLMMKDGAIWINGVRQVPPPVVAGVAYGSVHHNNQFYQQLEEGTPATLAADEYYLIGDNIQNSYDSRFFGPIKKSALVGVAEWTYWPMSRWKFLR